MKQGFRWLAVVVLCASVAAASGKEPPDPVLLQLEATHSKAQQLYQAGQYVPAMEYGRAALRLAEERYGSSHPIVADLLNLLGILHQAQWQPAQAESLYQLALELQEKTRGKEHPDVARVLMNLASLWVEQGMPGRAEPLLQRAREILEKALGRNHPDVAGVLQNLAVLYSDQGLYARAEPLLLRALEIQERALGRSHPHVAFSLTSLAVIYRGQGRYLLAESLFQRALEIREASQGKNHPEVVSALNNLAVNASDQGLHARAELFLMRALEILEKAVGGNHPHVAIALANLGRCYWDQGRYTRAEPLLLRALEIRESALGPHHPQVAQSLTNLGALYVAQGKNASAEPLYERAIAVLEEAQGRNHPDVALSLNNLAIVYMKQGSYARAEPLLQRALAISESALGKDHPEIATLLSNTATLYMSEGLYTRGEALAQRALELREKVLGKDHPDVAQSLYLLAVLSLSQGQYAQAELRYQRALALQESALGRSHPKVAVTLSQLAQVHASQGGHARAEPLYERALAIQERTLGKDHPDVASTLHLLAKLRVAQQRPDAAVALFTRTFTLSERRLRQEALSLSETRLDGLLRTLRSEEEEFYDFVSASPANEGVRRLALSAALLLKGRSAEELADTSRTLYQSLGARDRKTFEQLQGLRSEFAALSHQGASGQGAADYPRRLEALSRQADALETKLARRSAPVRALTALPPPSEIVNRVAAVLPKDGALIEFMAYAEPVRGGRPGVPLETFTRKLRYLALVLLPKGETRALDLGPADPINRAASAMRDALARRDADYQALAQDLYQRVFQPLLPLLGHTRRLFLSPDGQLGLVPFAALHDGQRFLIDTYDFTYLTSGRDLLPPVQKVASSGEVVVLADPDFSSREPEPRAERSASVERFFSTLRTDLAERPWTPLPGTRQEAEAIQRLLPKAQVFMGSQASRQRLLQLRSPAVLHIATHGFFLEDAPAPEASRAVSHFGALGQDISAPRLPEPLLRSGLVLAGAGAPASGDKASPGGSALVTALELAGLNLWGTQLVVLSACDTGRGDIKLGQGVYGLRRAFVVAGAETVVMSLWKVRDDATSELMEGYYRHLLTGQGRAQALREAMLALRTTRPHPNDWAPFIAVGRDGPLRGLASAARPSQKP